MQWFVITVDLSSTFRGCAIILNLKTILLEINMVPGKFQFAYNNSLTILTSYNDSLSIQGA